MTWQAVSLLSKHVGEKGGIGKGMGGRGHRKEWGRV